MDSGQSSEFNLEMKGITKRFPGVLALHQAQLQLRRGEVHVLLGENGAGKSTLIKILSGAYTQDEGTIRLDGVETEIKGPIHAQELGISVVYQEFNLIPDLDAGKNIFLGKEPMKGRVIKRIDYAKMYEDSCKALEQVGANIDPQIPVHRLGIASQQMVEIAKAITSNAKILVLDEPSAVLTHEEINKLFAIIRYLTSQGVAVVYISHRLEEINQIGDRITVMRDGEYVATVDVEKGNLDTDYLIQLMVGRNLKDKFPKRASAPGRPLLQVDNMTRKGVFENISFSLAAGEVLGVAGLVGAGRTEIAKAIFGVDSIDQGNIYVDGQKVNIRTPRDAIRLGIGLAPEDRKMEGLVQILSVEENINLASLDQVSNSGVMRKGKIREIAEHFVGSLKVSTPHIKQQVMNLSGGNQQKVVLAKWMASKTKIMILDEPTRGIDVGAKVEVYHLMNRLAKEGVGILLISSELPELIAMCDRIIVISEGKLAAELSKEEATQEHILHYAAGGMNHAG
ncbi:D-xylose ABC transporter ATP-binding protein [Paenibacillus ferrarius]|uniref:D-xylose ABC transporter ATP-binding protein n=1 Tax=Paenibacillus ferrarius TaxID=1469647 RepID=A0A1V4HQQ3_9BACL|nr:sugar ABC transporter ATP-binding protein [Paenibacillus ferrarius]OPH59953.1 D-xylose ABC transporter ATP-binding protein [Paenibacillus ferrarius]